TLETFAAMDHSAEQPSRVDGRQLASPEPVARLDIYEVKEKAVVLFLFLCEKFERCQGTLSRFRFLEVSASSGDAQCAEGETGRGGAAYATFVIPVCFGAVLCDASPR